MNTKTKSKLLTRSAYLILMLLALAVVAVTLFTVSSFLSKRKESAPTVEETTATVTKAPVQTTAKESQLEKQTEPPVSETQAPAAAEPQTEEKEVSVEPLTFVLPLEGELGQGYSADLPVFSITMNDYRVHSGIDIAAGEGSEVYVCANGKITQVYDDAFMGKCVTVDHGNGLSSHYMSLQTDLPSTVQVGATVKAGQLLGGVGDSAMIEVAQSPHLHFAMTLNGASVDPVTYIPALASLSASMQE